MTSLRIEIVFGAISPFYVLSKIIQVGNNPFKRLQRSLSVKGNELSNSR